MSDVTSVDVEHKRKSLIKWSASALIGASAIVGTVFLFKDTNGALKESVQVIEGVAEAVAIVGTASRAADYIDYSRSFSQEQSDYDNMQRILDNRGEV